MNFINLKLKLGALAMWLVTPCLLWSQDIEQIAKAPLLVGNGGISISQIGQASPDSISTLTPYSYYLSGNLNLNILGVVNLPMSFAYTNNQTNANLAIPFNRFSLSPSYKWVTAHLGYASMNFSPYTLSGHEFYGAGVEVTPGDHFRVAAMHGRFRRATEPDSLYQNASYKRMGTSFLVGYQNDKMDVTANILKARDDMNSLHFSQNDSGYITPEDNLAGSIALKLKLMNNLSWETEYAISAINRDISASDTLNQNAFLITQGDMAVYHAFRSSIAQSSAIGKIGATYERIAPNYNTFGAYYYANDFENITIDLASSLIKWLQWSLNAGYQRDNLENQKTNTNERAIFSANTTSPLGPKLVLGLNFSNVQSFIHIRDIYDQVTEINEFENIDTLSYTQLNRSAGAQLTYALKANQNQRQNINLSFVYQEASDKQSDDLSYVGNQITNSMLAYQYSLIPMRLNIATNINLNQNRMPDSKMDVMSYSLSIQKTFATALKTALVTTYSNAYNNYEHLSDVLNVRVNAGCKIKKRHAVNLSLAMVYNQSIAKTSRMYSANLNYNYVFNFKADRRER